LAWFSLLGQRQTDRRYDLTQQPGSAQCALIIKIKLEVVVNSTTPDSILLGYFLFFFLVLPPVPVQHVRDILELIHSKYFLNMLNLET